MSQNFINVEIADEGGKLISSIQNITDIKVFSDLIGLCEKEMKELDSKDTIINNADYKIYVKGTVNGGHEKINALVEDDYNVADICFNQKLFASKPKIHFHFNYYRFNFHLRGAVNVSLRYFCGSKSFGQKVLSTMNSTIINKKKMELEFPHKLPTWLYEQKADGGLLNSRNGLGTENCVIFTVIFHRPMRPDSLQILDTLGVFHLPTTPKPEHQHPLPDTEGLELPQPQPQPQPECPDPTEFGILFRDAELLKSPLQTYYKNPLPTGAIYFLLHNVAILGKKIKSTTATPGPVKIKKINDGSVTDIPTSC